MLLIHLLFIDLFVFLDKITVGPWFSTRAVHKNYLGNFETLRMPGPHPRIPLLIGRGWSLTNDDGC